MFLKKCFMRSTPNLSGKCYTRLNKKTEAYFTTNGEEEGYINTDTL
jgi:hypothetical protein